MTTTLLPLVDADCTPAAASHAIGTEVASTLATTLKALAEPLRLRMLSAIASSPTGESCVCDLAELADVSQPTVSHHLKVLKDVGVLVSERRGTWVWYRVADVFKPAVATLLDSFAPAVLDHRLDERNESGLSDVDAALVRLADELGTSSSVEPALVLATVRESYTALARSATVTPHLISLTARFARQRLDDLVRDREGARPQVLFVCVANAGRSQLAAALVRHYAGDRVVVRSAGSTPATAVHPDVQEMIATLVDDPGTAYPKPLTDDAVRAADVVVTMGCGDVCPVIPGVRYDDWSVGDPALASPEGLAAIRSEIDRRVRLLLADLVPDLTLPTEGSALEGEER
ncbi:metalloregulator ArsR/SmtB family transcription factor [Mumia sp. DW29H23]|uniref:metalloregulator ArsR/SmtB family transcription factor n=1 Tax=Mumia sp. DW29H23 TaxID=3421241 RepID=UPI003D690CDE